MLTSFTLKNFKSFKEATLHLTPTVTFLIGANGSGKSNALEGLRFISWLGEGMTFEEIERILAKKLFPVRGTLLDLYRRGEKTDVLSIGFDIEVDKKRYSFTDEIVTSLKEKHEKKLPRFSICSEQLYDEINKKYLFNLNIKKDTDDTAIYKLKSGSKISLVLYDLGRLVGGILFYGSVAFHESMKIISKKTNESEDALEMEKVKNDFIQYFSNVCFFDFKPAKMRDYVPESDKIQLEEDGSNLSDVLQKLCGNVNIKQKLIDVIRSLPEEPINDIQIYETEDHYVRFSLIEERPAAEGDKTPATLLSDGTLRALAIAAALYSAPEGSLLVIEEVDNGIHPSRIQHLVDKMYEIAAERKIQILVTTHDPAMMNAIPPQEKGNVLCCYRSKEDGTSKILRIADSPHADFITISHKLGDYFTTEQFDAQIKDTRSAQEVHEDQMKWLEQFMQSVSNFDKGGADE